MTYRFIGSDMELGDVKLNAFGESIELPEAEAAALIARNAPLLPAADFDAIGFTAAELDTYKWPGARCNEDPTFAGKHLAARIRLHELRTGAAAPAKKKKGLNAQEAGNGNG